jgi:peptidoglycan/LPS O-acetylase OafA/YrhL
MGFVRFSLAFAVLLGHLAGNDIIYPRTAVFGFFILSGFLITKTINEVYLCNNRRQITRFFFNRAVRIYPAYWACLMISCLMLIHANNQLFRVNPNLFLPRNFQEWITNIGIFGLWFHIPPASPSPFLIPIAWSLAVELYNYLLMALVSARSKKLTWGALIISGFYTAYLIDINNIPRSVYFNPFAHSLLFMMGSLLYHYRDRLKSYACSSFTLNLILVNIALYTPDLLRIKHDSFGTFFGILYICAGIIAYSILSMSCITYKKSYSRTIDQFLADISYPLFLVHMSVVAYMGYITKPLLLGRVEIFILSGVLSFALSIGITLLIEVPLKKVRAYIRKERL